MLKNDSKKHAIERDLKTLATFIGLYCKHSHRGSPREKVTLKTHDVTAIAGQEMHLCHECTKLLTHAFIKRSVCPMDPKPQCKHCPNHCYAPKYRDMIRQVMKTSGKRLLLTGRVHYLLHFLY